MAIGTVNFESDVIAFADLRVRLALEPEARGAWLEKAGLDEAAFDRLETLWDDRLTQGPEGDDGIPTMLLAYNNAFSAALMAHGKASTSIKQFAEATRTVRSGDTPETALKRAGVTLSTYLRAHAEWTKRALNDDEIADALSEALEGE